MTLAPLKLNGQLVAAADKALEAGKPDTPPETTLIATSELRIDQTYQRTIAKSGSRVIRKIIAEFDWMKFGVLIVGDTADGYAVIDGQHRAVAARHLRIPKIPAIVRPLDTDNQAGAFIGINMNRTAVSAIDKFRAQVVAGDETAVAIDAILTERKIELDQGVGITLKPRMLRSIGAVNQTYGSFGADLLGATFDILIAAQPEAENLLTGFNLQTTIRVLERIQDNDGDLDRLQSVLSDTDFETLKDRASKIKKLSPQGPVYKHGASLLMATYNQHLRAASRLKETF